MRIKFPYRPRCSSFVMRWLRQSSVLRPAPTSTLTSEAPFLAALLTFCFTLVSPRAVTPALHLTVTSPRCFRSPFPSLRRPTSHAPPCYSGHSSSLFPLSSPTAFPLPHCFQYGVSAFLPRPLRHLPPSSSRLVVHPPQAIANTPSRFASTHSARRSSP